MVTTVTSAKTVEPIEKPLGQTRQVNRPPLIYLQLPELLRTSRANTGPTQPDKSARYVGLVCPRVPTLTADIGQAVVSAVGIGPCVEALNVDPTDHR